MKTLVLLFITLFSFQFTHAQSESALVEETLQKYIEGSSYTKLEMLESSFSENAKLYLIGRDGFELYTPKEYAGFLKMPKKASLMVEMLKF
jgi:hypothetical protein